ncbi:MAG: Rab family GTPase [Candidatus Hodarchaeota archaeon]
MLLNNALFKVIVTGEGGVGKTCLVQRYTRGTFYHTRTTIGVGFATADVHLNGRDIKLQIWDFGGEERFRRLLPSFCKGASGALVLFDLTRFPTFLHLNEWLDLIRDNTSNIPLVLAGSKADLANMRVVDREQIAELTRKYNIEHYYEVSAKDGMNIEVVFTQIAELIVNSIETTSMNDEHGIMRIQ